MSVLYQLPKKIIKLLNNTGLKKMFSLEPNVIRSFQDKDNKILSRDFETRKEKHYVSY